MEVLSSNRTNIYLVISQTKYEGQYNIYLIYKYPLKYNIIANKDYSSKMVFNGVEKGGFY